MFAFIERDVIVEIFSVNEMCLFFIKLIVHRIIHFDMSFLRKLCNNLFLNI